MVETKQALITVGGSGHRLKMAGVEFQISKAFFELEGQPMFYWSLAGLYLAGVERLVIVGSGADKLNLAKEVLESAPFRFDEIKFHQDPGLGSNGLPYQAREHLEALFFFECGHSVSEPEHYSKMEGAKRPGNIVMSSFRPTEYLQRPIVRVEGDNVLPIGSLSGEKKEFVVGSPRGF